MRLTRTFAAASGWAWRRLRASAAIWGHYPSFVSPTVFRKGGFRFFFFSREEPRIHVHVHHSEGEAKFWLEPEIKRPTTTR